MNLIETSFDHDLSHYPTIIFEREKKEETEKAEERFNDQAKEQEAIDAEIRKRLGLENTSDKPQPQGT